MPVPDCNSPVPALLEILNFELRILNWKIDQKLRSKLFKVSASAIDTLRWQRHHLSKLFFPSCRIVIFLKFGVNKEIAVILKRQKEIIIYCKIKQYTVTCEIFANVVSAFFNMLLQLLIFGFEFCFVTQNQKISFKK